MVKNNGSMSLETIVVPKVAPQIEQPQIKIHTRIHKSTEAYAQDLGCRLPTPKFV